MKIASAEARATKYAAQKTYDPKIAADAYNVDLIRYQNFHNSHTDSKTTRKWALAYAAQIDTDLTLLDKASDFELRSIGVIGRAITKGQPIASNHVSKINADIVALVSKYADVPQKKVVAQPAAAPVAVVNRNAILASTIAAEIDAAIDEFTLTGLSFSVENFINANSVSRVVAALISKKYEALLAELSEALSTPDEQLKEAYAYLGKVRLRRFHALVQQVINACDALAAKPAKKTVTKAAKVKPASALAAKMRHQAEHAPLGLKSEAPAKIVGASTVWLYDTERRKLTVLNAETGQLLSVRGSTVINFDAKTSTVKMLRKPESFFTGNLAKKVLESAYSALTTKPATAHGRTSEHTIVLKTF